MNIKKIILGLLLTSLLISCGSTPQAEPSPKATPAPDWMLNKASVFPDDAYISAIGSGYTRTEALSDAEIQLAKQFGTNVKSTVKGNENYSMDNNIYSSKQSLSNEYEISINIDLVAAERTKPWYNFDTEEYYVCAYLDREKAFDIFKPNVIKVKNDFDNFYDESMMETDFFKQLSLLKTTQKIGEKFLEILKQAQMLSPAASRIYKDDFDKISEINIMLRELQLNAAVKIVVNDDYGHKVKDYVSKVFGNNGFIISNSDYHYIVDVIVDKNEHVDELSGIIASTPSITISLKDKTYGDTPFTYTASSPERIKSYRQDLVDKRGYETLEKEMNYSLDRELKDFFTSK